MLPLLFMLLAIDDNAAAFKEKMAVQQAAKDAEIAAAKIKVGKAEDQLKEAKSRPIKPGKLAKTIRDNAIMSATLQLSQARALVQKLEDAPLKLPFLDFRLGEIGRIPGLEIVVDNVIDKNTVTAEANGVKFAVRGISTKGIVDESVIEATGLFEVYDTEKILFNTMFVLRPFDEKRLK